MILEWHSIGNKVSEEKNISIEFSVYLIKWGDVKLMNANTHKCLREFRWRNEIFKLCGVSVRGNKITILKTYFSETL